MTFKLIKCDIKQNESIKIYFLGLPLFKLRLKKIMSLYWNVSDYFFYKKNRDKTIIALKVPAPNNAGKYKWGDYWIAKDLENALQKQDLIVRIDYVDRFYYPLNKKNDITITLRGLTEYRPEKSKTFNILYFLSHPEKATTEELNRFHVVACCSQSYTEKLKKEIAHAVYIPQFTNTEKFKYEPDENCRTQILFIGNSRGVYRDAVKFSVEQNMTLSLYGSDWEQFGVHPAGTVINNTDLNKYYSSAAITLNDHWQEMRTNGFISNRVFDVTASKGFLISDYLPEIEQIYGDAVPMFKTAQELKHLTDFYLSHPERRQQAAEKAFQITTSLFTSNAVAAQFKTLYNTHKNFP